MSGRRKGYLKAPTAELQSGLRLNISLYSAHLAKNRRVHYLDQPPTYPNISVKLLSLYSDFLCSCTDFRNKDKRKFILLRLHSYPVFHLLHPVGKRRDCYLMFVIGLFRFVVLTLHFASPHFTN